MSCAHILSLLDAYLDGELDIERNLETERHVGQCPVCRDELRKLRAVRDALRERAPYYRASSVLHEKTRRAVGGVPLSTDHRTGNIGHHWSALAASALIAAFLGAAGAYWLARPIPHEQLTAEIVAGHVRSLMVASRATDVASSDRHSVKPWFNGKLDFAPTVVDLTTDGFPLLGGRLDYLGGRPVAALVYRHRQHVINLFIWPSDRTASTTRNLNRQGYHLIHWTHAGMDYWAVSDLNFESLETFGRLFRAQTTPPPR